MQQEEFEIPRGASLIADMVSRRSTWNLKGASMHAVALRVPQDVLADVDALAKMAAKSRNSMLVHLLQTALEEVSSSLDAETRRDFDRRRWENLTALTGGTEEDV